MSASSERSLIRISRDGNLRLRCGRSGENSNIDASLFRDVEELRWRGPTEGFAARTARLDDSRLLQRALAAQKLVQ